MLCVRKQGAPQPSPGAIGRQRSPSPRLQTSPGRPSRLMLDESPFLHTSEACKGASLVASKRAPPRVCMSRRQSHDTPRWNRYRALTAAYPTRGSSAEVLRLRHPAAGYLPHRATARPSPTRRIVVTRSIPYRYPRWGFLRHAGCALSFLAV
ncbi:hypothetical protein VTN96DRAFT_3204 [Rasamsonia emersonii]